VSPTGDNISIYDRRATYFADYFEAVPSSELWADILDLLPIGENLTALDIGAGSGRDAAWLDTLGMAVVAAEPAAGMRREGQSRHGARVRWIDDRLPDLAAVHRLGLSFNVILLSAVWMHLEPGVRPRSFRKIVTLLKPGGVFVLSLRSGPIDQGRTAHPVFVGEIEALARDHGLSVLRVTEHPEARRPGVEWKTVCLPLQDDGSAGLPLIRGVVLNDDKSSTYKLGLLRAIAKIADFAPSTAMALSSEDDAVALPMGLVALNWLRLYLPLVETGLPQAPRNSGPSGLGFAKAGFRALMALGVNAQELRIGATFSGDRAAALAAAISDARRTIIDMPGRYLTFPNSASTIFRFDGRATPPRGLISLTPEVLDCWGRVMVPGSLWRTMLRYGCWIEPVIVSEWARLIKGYAKYMGLELGPGVAEANLAWIEPTRDTALARIVAKRLDSTGMSLRCVWSDVKLTMDTLDVDHALPWAAYPCGDLWNLVPSSRRVNQHQKRDRLPTQAALAASREPILDWWRAAWEADSALAARFSAEAQSALPLDAHFSLDAVFSGLEWRRLRVQQDQQAPEWSGARALDRDITG
jgi:SAM-dependent methyltransferase